MSNVFEYKIVDFYNDHPAITSGFVDEVLAFFAGGHTPEIRSTLISLRKVAEDGEVMLNRKSAPVVVTYSTDSGFDQDFARFMLQTFAGGHTPAIRSHLLRLEKIFFDVI